MTEPIARAVAAEPNRFTLNGEGVFVTLDLSGIDGRPTLRYQDSNAKLDFSGDEITIEENILGRLVSVTTVQAVDSGHTTFSILLPAVSENPGNHTISTIGVTSLHRAAGSIGHGQLTSYHVRPLIGSSSRTQS